MNSYAKRPKLLLNNVFTKLYMHESGGGRIVGLECVYAWMLCLVCFFFFSSLILTWILANQQQLWRFFSLFFFFFCFGELLLLLFVIFPPPLLTYVPDNVVIRIYAPNTIKKQPICYLRSCKTIYLLSIRQLYQLYYVQQLLVRERSPYISAHINGFDHSNL